MNDCRQSSLGSTTHHDATTMYAVYNNMFQCNKQRYIDTYSLSASIAYTAWLRTNTHSSDGRHIDSPYDDVARRMQKMSILVMSTGSD